MSARLTFLLLLALVPAAVAQQPRGAPAPATPAGPQAGCRFRLNHVGGVGKQEVVGSDTSFYANGGVELMCADSSAKISSDSVALTGRGRNNRVEFIGHVRYEDSVTTQTADHGVYYRNGERWEARGNVSTLNRKDGSTILGPALDYYRTVPGVRDTIEIFAVGRPTIHSFPKDTGTTKPEPYVIVADRVRMKGNDRTWAGGKVTIDRSDFSARGDSLFLDSGSGNRGQLLGTPMMKGLGRDSFELHGRRIDLSLDHQEITYIKALGQGHAISKDVDLVADTIGLDLEKEKLVQTVAWGDSITPHAMTGDYEIRGDSVAFDTPGQLLTEIRSYAKAWVAGRVDSVSHERDWLTGDTVVASFAQQDSAGTTHTVLRQLAASGTARSYYRVSDRRKHDGLPSINYSRGDRITIRMKTEGARGVDRVKIDGHVDGIHLEPLPSPADTSSREPVRGRR
jgi:hypothetical protein